MSDNDTSFLDKMSSSFTKLYDKIRNIFRSLFQHPSKVLFLGCDNAGKTTLMHLLREGIFSMPPPTRHPSNTEIKIGNMRTTIFDVGGHKTMRTAWSQFLMEVDSIIFIVDIADESKYFEVKESFKQLMEIKEKNVPVAVIFNKIDKLNHDRDSIRDSDILDDIQRKIQIYEQTGDDPVLITFTSMMHDKTEGGVMEAFVWLNELKKNKEGNE